MNANELADFLEKHLVTSCAILGDVTATAIITTLRQQQAKIEALKPYKEKIEAMERDYAKHFEAALAADDVWKRATGGKP